MIYSLAIKPLSVNAAYRGRRFATPELEQYKQDLGWLLPRGVKIPPGPLSVTYVFGLSSKGADVDNCVKALQDCLAEHYGFNDKMIYEIRASKVDVPKGEEYVAFSIEGLTPVDSEAAIK